MELHITHTSKCFTDWQAFAYLSSASHWVAFRPMETWEIRQKNLLKLLKDRFEDSPAKLASAIERSDAYVWQLCYGNKSRFGERITRHIEEKLQLPEHSLSGEEGTQNETSISLSPTEQAFIQLARQIPESVRKEMFEYLAFKFERVEPPPASPNFSEFHKLVEQFKKQVEKQQEKKTGEDIDPGSNQREKLLNPRKKPKKDDEVNK